MKKSFLATFILGVFFMNWAVVSAEGGNSKELGLKKIISQALEQHKVPAIGVLVVKNEKVVHFSTQGLRSLQHKPAVTKKDQWHLGSDTKAMTALLIAKAVEEGRLKYDSSITDFFDANQIYKENKKLKITDLLMHQSQLRDVQEVQGGKLWPLFFKSKLPVDVQRLEMTMASLNEPPKTNENKFHYGNINYIVLGSILEKLYKKPWEDLLIEKVFKPLEMKSCGFGVAGRSNEEEPSQPWGHTKQENVLLGLPPKYKADNPPMLGPAGTVHCSLEDWGNFMSELLLMWKGQGRLLIHKKVMIEYFKNSADNSYTQGGWIRDGNKYQTPVFQHSGSNTFNYAHAFMAPEKNFYFLVVMNSAQAETGTVLAEIIKNLSQ